MDVKKSLMVDKKSGFTNLESMGWGKNLQGTAGMGEQTHGLGHAHATTETTHLHMPHGGH